MIANLEMSEEGKRLKEQNHNDNLENFILNRAGGFEVFIVNDRVCQKMEPIYKDALPGSFIRSQFFAPTKYLFGYLIPTYWVNLMVIWFMSLILYLTLYFDLARRVIDGIGKFINGNA